MRAITALLSICGIFWSTGGDVWAAAPASRPAAARTAQRPAAARTAQRAASWHKGQIATACKSHRRRVVQVLRYDLPPKVGAQGVAVAILRSGRSAGATRAVAVLYRRCKGRRCRAHCVALRRAPCRPPRRRCHHSIRALQLVDLKASTTIKPSAGSWYEAPLTPPKSLGHPALVLQSRLDFGPKDARQTREQIFLLSLQTPAAPKLVYKDASLVLWSPKIQARRKIEAGGVRMTSMQLQQPAGAAPELTVLKKGIPTATNRCICKRLDQSRRYRLTRQGFRRIHSL